LHQRGIPRARGNQPEQHITTGLCTTVHDMQTTLERCCRLVYSFSLFVLLILYVAWIRTLHNHSMLQRVPIHLEKLQFNILGSGSGSIARCSHNTIALDELLEGTVDW
jgi:hypothetical protein